MFSPTKQAVKRIEETFPGESFANIRLVENKIFVKKKDAMPPHFTEKTFANSHEISKVFFLEIFLLYRTCTCVMQSRSCQAAQTCPN